MPTVPNGEKRPADVIANAVRVAQIATGEAEETRSQPSKPGNSQRGRPPQTKSQKSKEGTRIPAPA